MHPPRQRELPERLRRWFPLLNLVSTRLQFAVPSLFLSAGFYRLQQPVSEGRRYIAATKSGSI